MATEFNVKVGFSNADMSKPAEIRAMVVQSIEELGGADILVNSAGIQHTAVVEEFPDEKWDAILAINLSSNKAVLPYMKEKKWGRIIYIASAHRLVASATKTAYVAAKHGVVGLTKAVALETAATGTPAMQSVQGGF